MAAANESQGLKIAVAAFIALTVILTVTSYFLYSGYSQADARLTSANEDLQKKSQAASLALTQYDEIRGKVGTRATEPDQAKEEINAAFKKVDQRLDEMIGKVNAAIQRVQTEGAQGTELEEAKQNVQKIVSSIKSEPNKTFVSSMDRMAELMDNISILATEVSLNYVNLRKSLESATSVGKQQVDVQTKAAEKSQADVLGEQQKHEAERNILVTKVGELQAANDKQATENANLATKVKQQEEDFTRQRETLTTMYRETRDQLERKELILDRPDGHVIYVDYERREVLVDLTRRQGARPQMKMTIFDARSPGIPTEKPKGTIELTQIGDQSSAGRIIKTYVSTEPIRIGDIVYSAAWSPNQPMRFALVGKMDVNRDGRDDRQELKRMIEEAGGVIDYDLPPPELGKETGTLTPRIDWYVIDTRVPLRDTYIAKTAAVEVAAEKLNQKMGEVVKEARLNGIRPLPIERLLAFLGYDMNAPHPGRPEGVNLDAIRRLTAPRRTGEQVAKPAAESKTSETKADSDEMKDEKPKAATKKKAQAKKKSDDGEGSGN